MQVNYINQPLLPVTILLVGAGGNGSQMINQLGRINYCLCKLGHPGLHVILMDYDIVSDANPGRQLFNDGDVGEFKANVLIGRINRFYGTSWESRCEKFTSKTGCKYNLLITCTDGVDSRITAHKLVYKAKNTGQHQLDFHYWLDLGNLKNTGQVILSSPKLQLPTVIDLYPDAKEMEAKDNTPSCSLAEALSKQDLMINTFVCNVAAQLLYEMFTQPEVDWKGAYINLRRMNIKKIRA